MLTSSFAHASQPLRTSYYSQNVAPQLFFDDMGRPISGILFDITHAIAEQLSMELEMLPIPRKRIEQSLETNIVDMHCVANPKWYNSIYLKWSDVIYNNPDILINRLGIKTLAALSDYKQLKIGTTLGYVYPELSSYIENENTLPVISMTPAESYEKYRKNKISGFVSASIEASYFYKKSEDSVIHMNDNEIHCALSPSLKKETINNINTAIGTLKESGEIETILQRYKKLPGSQFQIVQAYSE
tara:strand:+ start:361 stop:1092 length:732 start_codon:yes stop_codon:yes gene_type:complete